MSEFKNKCVAWIKANRYYIVLALCILTVSGTYLLLNNAVSLEQTPRKEAQYVAPPVTETPLPDLAEYFPPELEPEKQSETTKAPSVAPDLTQEDTAMRVSADAPEVEKAELHYKYPLNGKISKGFSGDTLVFSKTMSDWRIHSGIDIAAEAGTDVCACADGTVEDVFTDERMGITIVLRHPDGVQSIYSNLSSGLLVEVGQSIRGGEVISSVGTSALFEAADESHLHFELTKDGTHIDPLAYLQ